MTELDATNDLATHSLELVHRELHETLDSARGEIEDFVDGQGSQEALARAAEYLHLASGALRIVEIHGAALLADEMEQTCQFLIETKSTDAADKGMQALTRAMVQLPAYLDRLLSGGRDVALVLLPLLNDLRAVRGRPLMSEGTLLLLKTGPLERMSKADGAGRPLAVDDAIARVIKRQRHAFQAALLGWIRGENVDNNLDELIRVCSTLESSATEKYVQQFWGVLCAVFVALRAGGLESSIALKRLIGQADRQLKRLVEAGESDLVESPPEDLLNNLLYYVARASCDDERVLAVRSEFGLDELVPGDEQLEQARESLAGPSIKLMRTVAVAIKQDLGAVKDSLDIFVRTGMQDFRQLLPQLEMLAKIGDTLGVLGLDKAQATIEAQVRELNEIADAGQGIDEHVLEGIATVILKVEDELDQELIRAVLPGNGEGVVPSEAEVQYSQVTQAVMNECIANMARVKEAVTKFVDEPTDTRPLEQVAPQLRGIAAGLLMLNKTAAVRLIERVGTVISDGLVTGDSATSPEHIERLADTIVSLEYYMETVSAGRKDPWYMLDNAARCLDLLERRRPLAPAAAFEEAVEPTSAAPVLEPTGTERGGALAEAADATAGQTEAALPEAERLEVLSALGAESGRADPELLEIFIEEAKGELEKIRANLRAWLSDTQNAGALVATRRSFHTLKGSGRTVGAKAIGEFAWSIENLMNRLINQTLRLSAPITAFIEESVKALPELIDQLELGIAPKVDVEALCATANALAAGEIPAAMATAGEGPSESRAAIPAPQIDPVLAEIFVKEIRGHLATLRGYLSKATQSMSAPVVDETLYRAGHTLLGSANMANYEPCVAVAGPLSEYLRLCYESKSPVTEAAVGVLGEAADAIETIADRLLENEVVMPEAELVARLDALAESMEKAAPEPARAVEEEPAEEEPAEEIAEVADTAPAEAVSFDPEIAAIFADEAAELLDQSELSVQELRTSAEPAAAIGELQRLLHTLKGGARMAGILEMGDLSHALETLLSALGEGRVRMERPVVDLVQRTLDELQLMRDSVEAARPLRDSSQLHEDLKQAAGAAPAAEQAARAAGIEAASAELSRKEIVERTINRPLDFDFTAEEASDSEQVAIPTMVMPGLEIAQFSDSGEDEIELTGTVEFSDEEMARLQQLAFEQTQIGVPEPAAEPAESSEAATSSRELLAARAPDEHEAAPAEPSTAGAPPVAPPEEPAPYEPAAEEAAAGPAAAPERPAETGPSETERPAAPKEFAAEEHPTLPVASEVPGAAEAEAPLAAPGSGDARIAARAASDLGRLAERAETARVDAELLNSLLNSSGEISIFQARLNQQLHSIDFHLSELGQTVTRLREQLRKLEAETEAEILHRHQDDTAENRDFDPLELDRYSTIQQLSRALAETANDVASINDLLQGLTAEADTLLTQQGRVTAEIQDGLMQTRMVPFQRHVARFARVVRQAALDTGKAAEFHVDGAAAELDREILDSMLPAFEHLLRNAVVHGIEPSETRRKRGKPSAGQVHLKLRREGSEVSIEIADDGAGLDLDAIRRTALDRGLIGEEQEISQRQAAELILQPGFSTATELTQAAGRGVGMDIVDNELKKLGGSMHIETRQGLGTKFVIRLPYTLAITHALIVDVGDETFALPLTTVEGITRVRREHLLDMLTHDDPKLDYGELSYRLQHLGSLVGGAPSALPEDESAVALVLIRAGEYSTALLTDNLEGSREVVVKGLGPHIGSISGVTGATILGDGRVIMILDAGTLVRRQPRRRGTQTPVVKAEKRALTALVVDDSITVRRVTERLLERRGIRVVTARDGLDAITVMQETDPDVILLDIEMPRMDGYQFAAHVRNDEKYRNLPIIMITSRSGQKHRAKAIELGVNEYLSKPYQENQLIAAIEEQLGTKL